MATCPACANPVSESHRFCPTCGARLDVISDEPTGTAPQAVRDAAASPAPRSGSAPSSAASSGGPSPSPGGSSRSTRASRPGDRFPPGTVLAGRYRVVGLLGRGGMGEVYRADDLKLEHPVALKFLPRALEGDPERLERLYGEVRLARLVSHPAVCRVWDVGEAEGQHFLSMEFVDGENLSSLLRRIGRFPPDKAIDVARQICAGLAAAHETGVLHRDLKPANVMLDGQGKVRLTDFGLAGVAEELSGADVRSGTPSYMSPEQLTGQDVTVRSDIYSLGLVIYELVTGRRAFEGKGLAELTRKHRDERPIEPSAIVPDLDPAVERTILACLEKDPKRRPPSAHAASAMLSGRDPLEAAIAAGETPSPELVAAAGESEGLRPRVAAACLATIVVAALAVPLLHGSLHVYSHVPVDKAPAVLEDRARELLQRLGHTGVAVDSDSGLGFDHEYVVDVQSKDRSPNRWEGLRTGDPPVALFWYRQSPRPLWPLRPNGMVAWDDPPPLVSGMAAVKYDLAGRLVALSVVPPQVEAKAPPEPVTPDWGPLLEAARLDVSKLRAVEPTWAPPFHTDSRAAWEGTWPRRSDIPMRVEVAGYRGRPVWFQVVNPWTRPERDEPFRLTSGERIGRAVVILIVMSLVVTGAVLAKRNIRLGRGDRRGAFRLALTLFGLGMGSLLIAAHHVADITLEILLLGRGAGLVMLVAGLIWLFYLALEPYVRRLRPWTLISWARLLGGGWRDAVVARDSLIGMVWGSLVAAALLLAQHLPALLGQPAAPPTGGDVEALARASRLLADVVSLPIHSTLLGLCILLLFLVLRFLFRRDVLAAAALVALLTVLEVAQEETAWVMVPVAIVVYVAYAVLLLRFGVLSAIAGFFTLDLLIDLPLLPDPGSWTGSAAVLVVPLLILLAVLAFRSALGGTAPFSRRSRTDS
jgi:eukaryotic-like serine/threonine-protein kinase